MRDAGWVVLMIGGCAGIGKTTAAKAIARRHGAQVLQADDVWLALQAADTGRLRPVLHYFFEPGVWRRDPLDLAGRKRELAELICDALVPVVSNHLFQRDPVVIEGVWVTPAFASRADYQSIDRVGVAAAFIDEPDEPSILEGMVRRGHGIQRWPPDEQRRHARMQALHGAWLTEEARERGLPVVSARPADDLAERILAAASLQR